MRGGARIRRDGDSALWSGCVYAIIHPHNDNDVIDVKYYEDEFLLFVGRDLAQRRISEILVQYMTLLSLSL